MILFKRLRVTLVTSITSMDWVKIWKSGLIDKRPSSLQELLSELTIFIGNNERTRSLEGPFGPCLSENIWHPTVHLASKHQQLKGYTRKSRRKSSPMVIRFRIYLHCNGQGKVLIFFTRRAAEGEELRILVVGFVLIGIITNRANSKGKQEKTIWWRWGNYFYWKGWSKAIKWSLCWSPLPTPQQPLSPTSPPTNTIKKLIFHHHHPHLHSSSVPRSPLNTIVVIIIISITTITTITTNMIIDHHHHPDLHSSSVPSLPLPAPHHQHHDQHFHISSSSALEQRPQVPPCSPLDTIAATISIISITTITDHHHHYQYDHHHHPDLHSSRVPRSPLLTLESSNRANTFDPSLGFLHYNFDENNHRHYHRLSSCDCHLNHDAYDDGDDDEVDDDGDADENAHSPQSESVQKADFGSGTHFVTTIAPNHRWWQWWWWWWWWWCIDDD